MAIDATWLRSYEPELKSQSTEWHSPASPKPAKFRRKQENLKQLAICAYDNSGLLVAKKVRCIFSGCLATGIGELPKRWNAIIERGLVTLKDSWGWLGGVKVVCILRNRHPTDICIQLGKACYPCSR